jgi:hypothetical protein
VIISYAVLFHSGLSSVSKTSPAARIGPLRQWKIALSLAVVGALAAPFVFRSYQAKPSYKVLVPLTAQEKEDFATLLAETGYCGTHRSNSLDVASCDLWKADYERGAKFIDGPPSVFKYLILNVAVAAAAFVGVFGLAFLIPMLIRGVVILARRYWSWLNA